MKQTRAKLFFSGKILISLFAIVLFIGLSSSVSFAPTKINPKAAKMSDSELADIDAQAFFKIEHFASSDLFWTTPTVDGTYTKYNTGSQNVIRISLDMEVQAHGFVEAQRQGYRYGWQGATAVAEWGWDIDFPNFWAGDRSADGTGRPLVLNGIFLDFGFDNIGVNATRTLNYIEVGSLNASGNVTQTIEKVNGMFAQGGTGTNNGVALRQTASGTRVINFNNVAFSFVFASKYAYKTYNGNEPVDFSGSDDIAPGHVRGTFVKIPTYHTTNDLHRPGDAGGW
ncbi:MAG: hypothetical protein WBN66_04970 [Smithella sp.]